MQQLDTTLNGAVNLIRYDKCSARHSDTTMQVFQHACDACVNPVLALYNHVKERLRCKAIRAFNRIMDIADEDQDGALNDDELNQFHEFCFGRPLADELNSIKQVSFCLLRFTGMHDQYYFFRSGCASVLQARSIARCWFGLWG